MGKESFGEKINPTIFRPRASSENINSFYFRFDCFADLSSEISIGGRAFENDQNETSNDYALEPTGSLTIN